MQRFSAWARWIATVIFIPIFTGVAVRFIWERLWERPETANVVSKFLLDLTEQTWVRFTALALLCFVAGLWLDWLLRKVDDSRTDERKALGIKMLNLADNLRSMNYRTSQALPQIMSYFAAARKLGVWVPDDRIFSIHTVREMNAIRSGGSYMEATKEVVDFMGLDNMITDYLRHVGTMLKDGNFREAKQYAKKSKATFDSIT
jgi:hypothetical protein